MVMTMSARSMEWRIASAMRSTLSPMVIVRIEIHAHAAQRPRDVACVGVYNFTQ